MSLVITRLPLVPLPVSIEDHSTHEFVFLEGAFAVRAVFEFVLPVSVLLKVLIDEP